DHGEHIEPLVLRDVRELGVVEHGEVEELPRHVGIWRGCTARTKRAARLRPWRRAARMVTNTGSGTQWDVGGSGRRWPWWWGWRRPPAPARPRHPVPPPAPRPPRSRRVGWCRSGHA